MCIYFAEQFGLRLPDGALWRSPASRRLAAWYQGWQERRCRTRTLQALKFLDRRILEDIGGQDEEPLVQAPLTHVLCIALQRSREADQR
jgi:hypothetical protein